MDHETFNAFGAFPKDHLYCLCNSTFFDAFVPNATVKQAYADWQAGEALRNDPRDRFTLDGIVFEECTGDVHGVTFITPFRAETKSRDLPVLRNDTTAAFR